ncbi:hypothetical protein [Rheinheimera sp. EpRS3]|uniref:hypothetical protein n=1 Tax=Rheinheimera sp. EpRS3 TaxID=1712383 RepID=UPI00074B0451|nr:hypothetical protein [Rheinheimera sp. EpRS3]KUM51767.1 hypothetical protein AR688_07585 [Rheinheimera sp. EpRS3]
MNINATVLGQFFIFFIPLMGILSYYLGKRKTQTPKLATFFGILLAFIPPFALLYIMVLIIKNDIHHAENPR